jgi:hypothetical protein
MDGCGDGKKVCGWSKEGVCSWMFPMRLGAEWTVVPGTTVATHTHSAVVSIVESLILTVGGFALFKG